MSHKYATIEMKMQRGKPTLVGTGRTPRGQKYIKGSVPITPAGPSKKQFKDAITAAVAKLTESEAPTPPL